MFSARVQKSLPVITDPKLAVWRSFLAPLVKRALPPPTPRNFQATNVRGGIQISWSPLQRPQVGKPGPDGYELLRSVDGSFTGDVQVLPINNHQQTSFFDPFGTPTTVHYRIRATSGTSTNPQSLRGPESGVIKHTSLDPSDNSSSPTTRHDNYTNEKVSSMARFGNYGLEVYQGSSTVQSAPSSSSNSGGSTPASPGAPVPSGTAVSFGTITGGTNTNNDLQVGDGSTIEAVNTGVINATKINGVPITGSVVSANLAPMTVGDGTAVWRAIAESDVTNLVSDLALKAPLASPTLTGTPTAPTQAPLTNNTDIATTAYADLAVGVEKTRALAAEALLAPLASPALTGNPTAPTQTALTNNTRLATTAYTDLAVGVETTRATAAEALKAPLASPVFTGTVTLPSYAVAGLPVGATGQTAYASNGRKVGEGAGLGTGVPVYFSSSQWRVYSTDAQVLA